MQDSEKGSTGGTREEERLARAANRSENWQRWGTYLPERQWGTVREDYSAQGDAWESFPYEMSAYRAYRWGEDGLLGWTDRECRLCFSTSLWNGRDSHLKERLFGLSNPEGNHGEDVKENYYYLDATPTCSYAKGLYKYPQRAFPYNELRAVNQQRGYDESEYELLDTGAFDENRYFDVQIEYAKNDVEDTLIRLTISNRGPETAELTVLPTLTLRNNWSWRNLEPGVETRPSIALKAGIDNTVVADHKTLGVFRFLPVGGPQDPSPEVLFTENDSNLRRLDPGYAGDQKYAKDAFDRYVVQGQQDAVNPDQTGTKVAFRYPIKLAPGASRTVRLRLAREDEHEPEPLDLAAFEACFALRLEEADAFYNARIPQDIPDVQRHIARQAYAGLLWTKQFYYYISERWLGGDPAQPQPPAERATGRNSDWRHLFCRDVLSVPDKWEYPWFAAWDTAFQMIPMADIDPEYAKQQLSLLLREWYMHPNGQLPAYEYSFSDVNPPVHAWAVIHVYQLDAQRTGRSDTDFLERCFQKLLLNFNWWVNRYDEHGRNLFGGGFLGLDNIGVFDRSKPLADGSTLQQADGTAWMGLFCSSMLTIAVELAQTRPVYEDIASKFLEHYVAIVDAMNREDGLWDEEHGFYFDQILNRDMERKPVAVRSIVGIIPLFAVCLLPAHLTEKLSGFRKRLDWFLKHRPHLADFFQPIETGKPGEDSGCFIALVPRDRLKRVLGHVFDEAEFLSDYGVRSLSRFHEQHPYTLQLHGQTNEVRYLPGEGDSGLFGGNSNWRGPIWVPVNALLVSSLHRYHLVYGDQFQVEMPTGSGQQRTLHEAMEDLSARLLRIFTPDEHGRRAVHGDQPLYQNDPYWCDLLLFSEYFCGDTGRGLGASHQTGWTALAGTAITHQLQSITSHPEGLQQQP